MSKEEMITGLIEVPQKQASMLLEAGYLLMELGKNKEAEETFQGVAALLPHSEVPHMALGHLYFSQGKFNQSLTEHRAAAKLNANSALAFASVGEVLLFLKKPDQALKELAKAIELDPDGSAGEFAKSLRDAQKQGIFG